MANDRNNNGSLKAEERVKLQFDELKLRVDAYQKYLNTGLQVNAFYYAVTGAVLVFYLNKPDGRVVFFLLLPIFMGAVLGGIFLHGASLQKKASKKIEDILDDLNQVPNLNVRTIDDINLLRLLLAIFGAIFLLVGIILTAMPILRASVKTSPIPCDLWLFSGIAFCALLIGGFATCITSAL